MREGDIQIEKAVGKLLRFLWGTPRRRRIGWRLIIVQAAVNGSFLYAAVCFCRYWHVLEIACLQVVGVAIDWAKVPDIYTRDRYILSIPDIYYRSRLYCIGSLCIH